jgi:hypothetical protein
VPAFSSSLLLLLQRRAYFDSADYFLEVQGLQKDAGHASTAQQQQAPSTPATPVLQPLPMKLQPVACKHTAQPSRLSVRS